MTTKDEIRAWLLEGKAQGATHTLIVCDTFDYSDYPKHIRVGTPEEAERAAEDLGPMTRLMEVYSHALDLEEQLLERRARHFDVAPAEKR